MDPPGVFFLAPSNAFQLLFHKSAGTVIVPQGICSHGASALTVSVRDLTTAFGTARLVAFFAFAACREICEVSQGTIKKLMDKGFGFIKGESGELFFHHSSVTNSDFDSLREGQEVEYTEGVGPKGPRAENVTVVQP